jgi:deoxyribodipyrimidine photo-lyase
MNIVDDVKAVEYYKGGTEKAEEYLRDFVEDKLEDYDEKRNDPTKDVLSDMSPYLHFGQISPVYIAREVMKRDSPSVDAYLEELIVRRELSINFVYYNEYYDSYNSLPNWAKKTLNEHRDDKREYIYNLEELEKAQTYDPYWNSAQMEMVITGKMHGYMRMYWGKKILEWIETPGDAYRIALYLNNRYELDGRDPNGFTGVAWCFGKHDRAWKERPIFGKVRYMNDRGLRRKFNADNYVLLVKELLSKNKHN